MMIKLKVLCIPGWGESCCIFNKIKQLLNDYMEFNYIELPGFGNDILPEKDYVFDEDDPHDTGVNFEVGQNH